MPRYCQSTAATRLRFLSVSPDDALAQFLLSELAAEYSERYGGNRQVHLAWLRMPCAEVAPPDGGLLIGLLDGVPVTGGAFRRLDADTAELKRIWTDQAYRRRGYAMAILAELEATVVARGYRRVYLVTGNRQPEAAAMYQAAGYTHLNESLPSWGSFEPIAFAKSLR